jgi:malate dehydrogenase (oxaloacetate-decarboxylating)(NADP+)
MSIKEQALKYHQEPTPGKLEVFSTKPCLTKDDLSLAYTPGVADPCLEIHANIENVYKYTIKGNCVAVVSDGTAVLGLGNIGPEAGMPVMEGKCVLFKRFADIDAIPICLGKVFDAKGRTDADKLITVVETFEPFLGGINLEDIGSPACFKVETTLKKLMGIPVFHDDQHGTAIISTAAVLNAVKLTGRKMNTAKFVLNGAGAAGIACAEMYIRAGADRKNFLMVDSKGVIHADREDYATLNEEKKNFANKTSARTLADAMKGADVFIGVSVANCVTEEMVKSMAKDAIIFAMANPTPEIMPDLAWKAGAAVVGTGRSDFANQVNNVLGFPGIFRGALDTRASQITEEMKIAAAFAIAETATFEIPANVKAQLATAYPADAKNGMFDGKNPLKPTYVIPKPFDPRVVPHVARCVAEAAMKCGGAKIQIKDLDAYEKSVFDRVAAKNPIK